MVLRFSSYTGIARYFSKFSVNNIESLDRLSVFDSPPLLMFYLLNLVSFHWNSDFLCSLPDICTSALPGTRARLFVVSVISKWNQRTRLDRDVFNCSIIYRFLDILYCRNTLFNLSTVQLPLLFFHLIFLQYFLSHIMPHLTFWMLPLLEGARRRIYLSPSLRCA